MNYLLDSNVLIDYIAARFPAEVLFRMGNIFDTDLLISVVSKIEVLGFESGDLTVDFRTKKFIGLAKIYQLTPEIVDKTIEIRKAKKIKIPDAIIASTAIVNNLVLLSSNVKDFNAIPGLILIDPANIK